MILCFPCNVPGSMLLPYFTNQALQGSPEKHIELWQSLKSWMTEIVLFCHICHLIPCDRSVTDVIYTCIIAQAMLVWIYCHDFQSIYIVLIFNGDLNYCLFLRWLLKWLWQRWCRVYLVEQIWWKLVWICRSWAVQLSTCMSVLTALSMA